MRKEVLRGKHHNHHEMPTERKVDSKNTANSSCEKQDSNTNNNNNNNRNEDDRKNEVADINSLAICPCCDTDPVTGLERLHDMANEAKVAETGDDDRPGEFQGMTTTATQLAHQDEQQDCEALGNQGAEEEEEVDVEDASEKAAHDKDAKKILAMSINTAVAIGLHNFPEGLATFVAALNDPKVGSVLAVAIAIHNIPEGLCVSLPVYYATGNRWKAFSWGILSGLSEPLAALLGWLVLANRFSDSMYGGIFGGVAGMMVIISVKELLPTAHRYDPEDHVVTYSFMTGMAVMALSLVLFVL
jgi:zinc transporter, ZIP family